MSSDAQPITPARFAEALPSLPLSALHLKVLELRNNIAQLDYSNEQLRPYALGTAIPLSSASTTTEGEAHQQADPDCVEAIRENEEVIARMNERIQLVRAEVEGRGHSWTEFQSKEEAEAAAEAARLAARVNGVNGAGHDDDEEEDTPTTTEQQHSAWRDGTIQTGVIRGGEVQMNNTASSSSTAGGRIDDEALRRLVEQQMQDLTHEDDQDDEGGLHL
ncbi:hypothetical protein B0H63DRAFT_461926 [Podospora didyma]|uniref:Secondary alcohol dehydrogenase n=1 Tax=Podospora didyma TaxID=330526 RepID=A0AAE0U8T0_9PEZI|nr:hypothetical protein B0H63DRAFT_461926 [Podospora didyma]